MTLDTLYLLAFLFFIYAFLGWCAEVAFHALTLGHFVNRGFLNGPYCPIYGAGALLVLLCLEPIADDGPLLFLASFVLMSLLELLTGFVLEKLFHARWWDYSKEPFHLGPYICLRFSLIWGFACVFGIRIVHPTVLFLVRLVPELLGWILLGLFAATMLADLVVTLLSVTKLARDLAFVEKVGADIHDLSDRIGQRISDSTLEADRKRQEGKEKLEEHKEKLVEARGRLEAELDERRDRIETGRTEARERLEESKAEVSERLDDLNDYALLLRAELDEKQTALRERLAQKRLGRRRLLTAFPGLRSLEHQEALEKLREALKK